ncbi:hypothetical protein O181_129512 [Austropuccinia psidii MF-1]|uniref:Uncharacterized protein n=1 Tax=Austropuccinia psidii MF-1 TaxID=1389203 RepID=A0A9Q3KZD5_9BASI|nr:hypothetical protein [Austropuccinia psidii MF-1]
MPTLMHELASTSLPNPLQLLTCLRSHSTPKICLCGRSPISSLTHPHASAPLLLNLLTLLLRPQSILPTLAPHLGAPPHYASTPLACLLHDLQSLRSCSALPTCF